MARLPVLSARAGLKVLRKFSFHIVRQTGSYIHLWHDEKRVLVIVPNHPELAMGEAIRKAPGFIIHLGHEVDGGWRVIEVGSRRRPPSIGSPRRSDQIFRPT